MKKSPTRFIRRVDNKFTSASLDLNFQNMTTSGFDSRITFTRASSGTYFDGSGVLQTASTNVPRLDHSPTTLQSLGLLVEEQRTNSIRNNTMQGAVAGTPGTDPTNWISSAVSGAVTSKEIVAIGTENGINYIDIRYTTNGAVAFNVFVFEQATQIVAADTQTWTSTVYVKLVGGSLSNLTFVNRLAYRAAAGSIVQAVDVAFVPTSAALSTQRSVNTAAAAGATIARVTNQILATAAGASDFTLRIGLPQLELGAFATSVIPTTVAAATRNADVATMTGTNFSSWYNATEGSLFSYGSPQASNIAAFALADISDGTVDNRMTLLKSITNGNAVFVVIVSSSTEAFLDSGAWTATGKIIGTYKVNDFASSFNGSAALTDTTGTIPTSTQLTIGRRGDGGAPLNGHIQRIAYYPVRLSNDQLQALTR